MRLTHYLFILNFFFSGSLLFAQNDTTYIDGGTDTVFVRKNIVIKKKIVYVEELSVIKNNYFFLKPSASFLYFYDDYVTSSPDMLRQAFCYSIRERNGYAAALHAGFSRNRFIISGGYSVYSFSEKVNDYKTAVFYTNHYVQHQLEVTAAFKIPFKHLVIVPQAGLSCSFYVQSNTIYPYLNESAIGFKKTSLIQHNGIIYIRGGLEVIFRNEKRISPFTGISFITNILKEGKKNDTEMLLFNRYVTSLSIGTYIKF